MPSSLPDKRSKEGLLKISDLARETGVSTATIKFYLREGLLPPPTLKTGRNMAYYDRTFIERIRMIKELQQKRFLPLDVIKAILDQNDAIISPVELDTLLGLEGTFYEAIHYSPGKGPITRAQVLERYNFDNEELDLGIALGVFSPVVRDGVDVFEGDDVLIMETFLAMDKAGLGNDVFPTKASLPIYVEAMERLAREELKIFSRSVTGRVPDEELPRMAMAGIKLVEQFLVLLRRKLLLKLVQEMRVETGAKGQSNVAG